MYQNIIYERVGNKVYARYSGSLERWCVRDDPPSLLSYDDLKQMLELSDRNPTFKKQLDKVINLYYLLKDEEHHGKE